jgi:hypothetical protein
MLPQWATLKARMTMVIMLIFGMGLAAGHHLFYQSLAGQPPPSSVYDISGLSVRLTGQQVNLAIGSAFAVLVKAALEIAVDTAAEQASWSAIRTQSIKLASIDNLLVTRNSVWSMLDIRLWRTSLRTMLLSTVFW